MTPVEFSFLWYGDYGATIEKDGYQTLQTHWDIKPPWYQIVPLDFIAEVLWPGRLHDRHERKFVLEPTEPTDRTALLERAELVAFNKIDLLPDRGLLASAEAELRRRGREAFRISGATGEGVGELLGGVGRALDAAEREAEAGEAATAECRS